MFGPFAFPHIVVDDNGKEWVSLEKVRCDDAYTYHLAVDAASEFPAPCSIVRTLTTARVRVSPVPEVKP